VKKPLIIKQLSIKYTELPDGGLAGLTGETLSGQVVELAIRNPEGFRVMMKHPTYDLKPRMFQNSILSNYFVIVSGEPEESDWFDEVKMRKASRDRA
jgi:hypothetical protein